MRVLIAVLFWVSASIYAGNPDNLPANTWVRITSSPGDAKGREVPPGRASTWVYEPNTQKFLRYGGYTPTFTNALYSFDPGTLQWAVLFAHDETFPSNRPGGGSNWCLGYDSARKVIYIAGGRRSGGYSPVPYAIGDQGIWKYDPINNIFTKLGNALAFSTYGVGFNTYMVYDPVNDVIVASPLSGALSSQFQGKTWVFKLSDNTWESRSNPKIPSQYYGGSYPMVFDPSIGKMVLFKRSGDTLNPTQVWTYDAVTNLWDSLTTVGTKPPARSLPALAYDPDHQAIVIYGGSDGQYASSQLFDTWIYKSSTRTFSQINTPGLPKLNGALLYHQAFSHDPVHHCMLLNDPDYGVWAFKYDPASPPGSSAIDAESLTVGQAARNPAASGPAETFLSFPTGFNQRLLEMPDNSLLILNGTASDGAEIMWYYDPDAGVILKYGGCGNESSPYWAHYGNNLNLYDPGTERWHVRRVGEVSGAGRPATGCTRSNIYDSKRKIWWLMGGTSSGPYNPGEPGKSQPFYYDVSADRITALSKSWPVNPGNMGCVMSYSPDHDMGIVPANGKTYIFNCSTAVWTERTASTGPGALYGYLRSVYVSSVRKFFCIQSGTSTLSAWTYDPSANTWADVTVSSMPPYRNSKPGLAYDSGNDRIILISGQIGWNGTPLSDIWACNPQDWTWQNMSPAPVSGAFPSNAAMCSAYDSRHNAVIIGGDGVSTLFAYRYKRIPGTGVEKAPFADGRAGLLAYPSPFYPGVTLYYSMPRNGALRIYDAAGRMIWTRAVLKGAGKIPWNGSGHTSGVYIARLTAKKAVFTARLVLAR